MKKKYFKLAIAIVLSWITIYSHATTTYTVSYAANTLDAQFPDFGNLPNNILIEGSFTYQDGPNYNTGNTALYYLLSQKIKINGVATDVIAGGKTGINSSALQIGNNDTTLGFNSDNIYTFAFINGNNIIGNGMYLTLASPRFYDPSGTLLSSTALPLDANTFYNFSNVELLINYAVTPNGMASSYGNMIPISNLSFSASDEGIQTAVPEVETYSMLLVGLGVIVTLANRRRVKKQS